MIYFYLFVLFVIVFFLGVAGGKEIAKLSLDEQMKDITCPKCSRDTLRVHCANCDYGGD
jgi:hypothetical protein